MARRQTTLKEVLLVASESVIQLYAASKEDFAKTLLSSVKDLAEACGMVLAEAARIAEEKRLQSKAPIVSGAHKIAFKVELSIPPSYAFAHRLLSDAHFVMLGERKRMLSGERIRQALVLARADAELECLDSLFIKYVRDATLLKDLQTHCELAEKSLASGTLSEEELFASIAPVVAKLTEALNAVRQADSNICIPSDILDEESSEEEEHQSNNVDIMMLVGHKALQRIFYPVSRD